MSWLRARRAASMDAVAGVEAVPLGGDLAAARSQLKVHTRRWGGLCKACGEDWPCREYALAWRTVAASGEAPS